MRWTHHHQPAGMPALEFPSLTRADVDILAQRNFQRFEDILFPKAKSLAISDIAHLRA